MMSNLPEPQEPQELEIKVDISKMTFGDMEMALKIDGGDANIAEILPFLDRVVVGGVKHLPLSAMPQILDALTLAFAALANPKN